MKIDIVVKDKPDLSNPVIICGLPGSALVGKVAVDHLVATLPSKVLAEIYCEGLAPQVYVEENGTVSMLKNELYFWKGDGSQKRDLILYTADAQPSTPETEYGLSEAVIDFFQKEYKAKELVTLGAYVTGNFSQNPQVYATVTEESLSPRIREAGCNIMADGVITGMNGLLLGLAKLKGMSGYSLLGETSGYAIDPKASEALLVVLSRLLGVTVDMKELEQRAKEAQAIMDSAAMGIQQNQGQSDERKKPGYIT